MSLAKKSDITFDEVSRFLDSHPDFFIKHPELLRHIAIPHDAGAGQKNVSSLLEYQVSNLQKQLRELEEDNAFLVQGLEELRDLSRQIHAFVLQIMQTGTIDDMLTMLGKGLKRYYAADRLIMLIFDVHNIDSQHDNLHFVESGSQLEFMFTELFHRDKPLCNSLQDEHMDALFNCGSDDILSTVLLPMSGNGRRTLMVLGSGSRNRYRHGNELDLLVFISRLVNARLCEFLER